LNANLKKKGERPERYNAFAWAKKQTARVQKERG